MSKVMPAVTDEDAWLLIDSNIKAHPMISHQISQYNDFVSKFIAPIIKKKQFPPFVYTDIKNALRDRITKILTSPRLLHSHFIEKGKTINTSLPITAAMASSFKSEFPEFKDYDIDCLLDQTVSSVITSKLSPAQATENFEIISLKERAQDIERQLSYLVTVNDVLIESPSTKHIDETNAPLFPSTCIKKSITYGLDISLSIGIYSPIDKKTIYKTEYLGMIPLMRNSAMCNVTLNCGKVEANHIKRMEDIADKGGYFIVNGAKKILTLQEQEPRNVYNAVILHSDPKKQPRLYVSIKSVNLAENETEQRAKHLQIIWVDPIIKTDQSIKITNSSNLDKTENGGYLPVKVLFLAFGITEVNDMAKLILMTDDIASFSDLEMKEDIATTVEASSFHNGAIVENRNDALEYIGRMYKMQTFFQKKDLVAQKPVNVVLTQEEYIARGYDYISKGIFPHIGVQNNNDQFRKKAFFLGYMINKLLKGKSEKIKPEDRDNFMNKRLKTVSVLFSNKLSEVYQEVTQAAIRSTYAKMAKAKNPFSFSLEDTGQDFTKLMEKCLTVNRWTKYEKEAKDISKSYITPNYMCKISEGRKFSHFLKSQANVIRPRELDNSHWGIVSPHETPDGDRVGLNKALAITAYISEYFDPEIIVTQLNNYSGVEKYPQMNQSNAFIFVNGLLVGSVKNVAETLQFLRSRRRRGIIRFDVSISYRNDTNSIHIYSDEGRLMRPLLIVEKGFPVLNKNHIGSLKRGEIAWEEFLRNGTVEYLDKSEEDEAKVLIAFYLSELEEMRQSDPERAMLITHCEINPSTILGIGDAVIPFVNRVQSCRITYQTLMGKHSAGVSSFNMLNTLKGNTFSLIYPQRQMATTRYAQMSGLLKMPAGQNIYVAIMPWNGNNQEDSAVVNHGSVELGMLTVLHYSYYEIRIQTDASDLLMKPTKDNCSELFDSNILYRQNAEKLGPDGIIPIDTHVVRGDILVGKLVKTKEPNAKYNYTCDNLVYDYTLPGIVERIERGIAGDGTQYVKVIVSQFMPLGVGHGFKSGGDKIASTYAQKGTIGELTDPWDMPYTESGTPIDLMMSPLAYPSRMTISQFVESLTGRLLMKSSKLHNIYYHTDGEYYYLKKDSLSKSFFPDGDHVDATLGVKFSVEEVVKEIEACEINGFGNEIIYNPHNGKRQNVLVHVGPVFYQRLKHMVVEKSHARGVGKLTTLTQQPISGGKSGGGLRNSWMEYIAFGAQGAQAIIRDRFFTESDKYCMWFCKKCGFQAIQDTTKRGATCSLCNEKNCNLINISFSTHNLINYLAGANIITRIFADSGKK